MPDVVVSRSGNYAGKPSLTDDGAKLKAGKDYDKTLEYYLGEGESAEKIDNIKKFTAGKEGDIISVTAKALEGSPYTGTVTTTYKIGAVNFSKASIKLADRKAKFYYTGKPVEIKPEDITVKISGNTINYVPEDEVGEAGKEDGGYEIVSDSYINNTAKGKAKVTIKGTGKYAGSKTFSFTISAKPLSWYAAPENSEDVVNELVDQYMQECMDIISEKIDAFSDVDYSDNKAVLKINRSNKTDKAVDAVNEIFETFKNDPDIKAKGEQLKRDVQARLGDSIKNLDKVTFNVTINKGGKKVTLEPRNYNDPSKFFADGIDILLDAAQRTFTELMKDEGAEYSGKTLASLIGASISIDVNGHGHIGGVEGDSDIGNYTIDFN